MQLDCIMVYNAGTFHPRIPAMTNKLASVCGAAALAACLGLPAQAQPLEVTVSIPPQKYFVERIGGPAVRVSTMVRPGASPHDYEPTPQQMAALARSKAYFAVGVEFEKAWLPRFRQAAKGLEVVDTTLGIQRLAAAEPRGVGSHGHEHGAADPHVWLSPPLVRIQAMNIRDALIRLDPARAADYQRNHDDFAREVNRVDEAVMATLAALPPQRRRFLVFHPAWGYFARAYGLTELAIELEAKEPGPRQLAAVIDMARNENIRVLFVQPQFSRKSAEAVAQALSARIATLDPLAEDWGADLQAAAKALGEALAQGGR
jgi:zinc transport system substrate-binding protein